MKAICKETGRVGEVLSISRKTGKLARIKWQDGTITIEQTKNLTIETERVNI